MSDLYRGMDARAIVVKLQILSGAVVEERCFRAVEATGDASGAFVFTVTACTSDAAPILPVVYRVVKLCPLSARLLAVRLQELPTTFVLSSTVTMPPASVVPLEKPQFEGDACRESGTPQPIKAAFLRRLGCAINARSALLPPCVASAWQYATRPRRSSPRSSDDGRAAALHRPRDPGSP